MVVACYKSEWYVTGHTITTNQNRTSSVHEPYMNRTCTVPSSLYIIFPTSYVLWYEADGMILTPRNAIFLSSFVYLIDNMMNKKICRIVVFQPLRFEEV